MEKDIKKSDGNFMMKVASVIVDKRNLFFLLTIIGIIFSFFSRNWVEVENDLASFLPDDSETRRGLDIMEDQFVTFGTAQFMVANISLDDAWEIHDWMEDTQGVQGVEFDDSSDHYNDVSALYGVTFDYDEDDDRCLEIMEQLKAGLADQDLYVSTSLGNALSENIASEVQMIMVYAAVIIVIVLTLTSQTYAEVPVLILTFVVAMILNLGTNFLLGKISFVSNSVTSILQLALSLDYAVILSNRFKEEHETLPMRDAVVAALSKAIPEISASSLTTIGGLVAMMFMQFKIGPDMAICLIKSILFALLSVFVVMPGLLMVAGPWMDKTKHKRFIPDIPFVGKFAYATRFIIPPIFAVALIFGFWYSGQCPYAYGETGIETPKLNETQIAENMIWDHFTDSNFTAVVVPAGDYEAEKAMLDELESYEEVDYTMGLSNVEAMDGYMLADKLTPRKFSELADLDYELAQVIYAAYAAKQEEYGKIIGNVSTYEVPLMDMLLFVCDQIDEGIVSLEGDMADDLEDAKTQIANAKKQLQGEEYNRVLVYLNLPVGGDETYAFIDTIRETAEKYYTAGDVYVVGDSTTEYDFQKSFSTDNVVVSLVSIIIVLAVLLFTFQSAGMPILLILVIQGAIWLNFSIPVLTGDLVFFMSYLVVSSIQMGANIDYAIVIASRFDELKRKMSLKEAIIETMNFAFQTIITSGTILAVAGTLIGKMTSNVAIVGIGQSLGRGTIISIVLVMFILPQILLIGNKLVDKTSFSVPRPVVKKQGSGRVHVEGMVHGEISGTVYGMVHAVVDGDVKLNVISGTVREEEEHEE